MASVNDSGMYLTEHGVVEWEREGGVVRVSFTGYEAGLPPKPDELTLRGRYEAT